MQNIRMHTSKKIRHVLSVFVLSLSISLRPYKMARNLRGLFMLGCAVHFAEVVHDLKLQENCMISFTNLVGLKRKRLKWKRRMTTSWWLWSQAFLISMDIPSEPHFSQRLRGIFWIYKLCISTETFCGFVWHELIAPRKNLHHLVTLVAGYSV